MVRRLDQDSRLSHRNFGELLKYGKHTGSNLQGKKKKKTRENQNPALKKDTVKVEGGTVKQLEIFQDERQCEVTFNCDPEQWIWSNLHSRQQWHMPKEHSRGYEPQFWRGVATPQTAPSPQEDISEKTLCTLPSQRKSQPSPTRVRLQQTEQGGKLGVSNAKMGGQPRITSRLEKMNMATEALNSTKRKYRKDICKIFQTFFN